MGKIQNWAESKNTTHWIWYTKRLSANDSGATASHQAGIYIPKQALWTIFPSIQTGANPDAWFEAEVLPFGEKRKLRAIWYNKGSRNESRVTQWNTPSRILDPEMTGGLVVFAFYAHAGKTPNFASVWFCCTKEEEDAIEEIIGIVEPGEGNLYKPKGHMTDQVKKQHHVNCILTENDIPAAWSQEFPTAAELIQFALTLKPVRAYPPDSRLLARRECETALFFSVERTLILPKIQCGFTNIDEFIDLANSVTNRRKSRAGRSLELQLKYLFVEEKLLFSHGEISENNKRPDFIFPSVNAYQDSNWPDDKIRMLAAKTTCKDRWRQILNEADRIPIKHLITLQQGVSENQFKEMRQAGVVLIVPEALHGAYPKKIRSELLTLNSFIEETKQKCSL